MDVSLDIMLRDQLVNRRHRLEEAIAESRDSFLIQLIQEVDAALERMDEGTYGLCTVCHESIETERIIADPLVCACLDHLNPDQLRSLERDLELATHVQRRLLPQQHLALPGWEVTYHYEPARLVSGDYCDVVTPEVEGGDLFFFLGDVSGKGVAASMLMSNLHAIFRSLLGVGLPVGQLVEQANHLFCESTLSAQYATLVCGRAGRSGEIEICNAGHCPPLLNRGYEVTGVEATGLPVGLFSSALYSIKNVTLSVGDSLVLYTDGLTEAQGDTSIPYGVERLSELLRACHKCSARGLIDATLTDLVDFKQTSPNTDDLTLMVIKRTH